MSKNTNYLHSHSGIERERKFPKHLVLVDEDYKNMFLDPKLYRVHGKDYFVVSILEFVNKGGVFKNFSE